jgi:hypothetical protein
MKGKFEIRPTGEESFIQKVDEVRRSLAAENLSLGQIADRYAAARAAKDEHEELIKADNVQIDALSKSLSERMEEEGLSTVQTTDGRVLSPKIEPYAYIQDPELFEKYLGENPDLDYLYQVNTKRLTTFCKGLFEEGHDSEIPPGVLIYLRPGMSFRKAQ